MTIFSVIGYVLAVVALAGALVAVFAREVLRLALGLGVLLLAAAGIFLLYGAVFPAVAELFLYVGGVLVLLLFTLMLLRRDETGSPQLSSRHRASSAIASVAVFAALVFGFGPLGPAVPGRGVPVEALGGALLGRWLPVFELLAALLLVALVAAVALTADRGSAREGVGDPESETGGEPVRAVEGEASPAVAAVAEPAAPAQPAEEGGAA